jgi:hypothetical protein
MKAIDILSNDDHLKIKFTAWFRRYLRGTGHPRTGVSVSDDMIAEERANPQVFRAHRFLLMATGSGLLPVAAEAAGQGPPLIKVAILLSIAFILTKFIP